MAEIENIHSPICTQPIPSSWQNGLPPALATDERRGATSLHTDRFGQMILLIMMVTSVMMVIRLVLVKLLKLIVDNIALIMSYVD